MGYITREDIREETEMNYDSGCGESRSRMRYECVLEENKICTNAVFNNFMKT